MAVAESDTGKVRDKATDAGVSQKHLENRERMMDFLSGEMDKVERLEEQAFNAREDVANAKTIFGRSKRQYRAQRLEADAQEAKDNMIRMLSTSGVGDDDPARIRFFQSLRKSDPDAAAAHIPEAPTSKRETAVHLGMGEIVTEEMREDYQDQKLAEALYRDGQGEYNSLDEAKAAAKSKRQELVVLEYAVAEAKRQWEERHGTEMMDEQLAKLRAETQSLLSRKMANEAQRTKLLAEATAAGRRVPGLLYDKDGKPTGGSLKTAEAMAGIGNTDANRTRNAVHRTLGFTGEQVEAAGEKAWDMVIAEIGDPATAAVLAQSGESAGTLFGKNSPLLSEGGEVKLPAALIDKMPGDNPIEKRRHWNSLVGGMYWRALGIDSASNLSSMIIGGLATGRMDDFEARTLIRSWARSSANREGLDPNQHAINDWLAEDFEVMRAVLAKDPETLEIMLTLWDQEVPQATALNGAGASDWLRKKNPKAVEKYRQGMLMLQTGLTERVTFDYATQRGTMAELASDVERARQGLPFEEGGGSIFDFGSAGREQLAAWENFYFRRLMPILKEADVVPPTDQDRVFSANPRTRLLNVMTFYLSNKDKFDPILKRTVDENFPDPPIFEADALKTEVEKLSNLIVESGEIAEMDARDEQTYRKLLRLRDIAEQRAEFGVGVGPNIERLLKESPGGLIDSPDMTIKELEDVIGAPGKIAPRVLEPGEGKKIVSEVLPSHRGAALINEAADKWNFTGEELVNKIMEVESQFGTKNLSHRGALGPMQLMPDTAKSLGVDPMDPRDNIKGGIELLREELARFKGDLVLALAAYNAGSPAVRKTAPDIPNYKETIEYIKKILGPEAVMGRVAGGGKKASPSTGMAAP